MSSNPIWHGFSMDNSVSVYLIHCLLTIQVFRYYFYETLGETQNFFLLTFMNRCHDSSPVTSFSRINTRPVMQYFRYRFSPRRSRVRIQLRSFSLFNATEKKYTHTLHPVWVQVPWSRIEEKNLQKSIFVAINTWKFGTFAFIEVK